jgi:hypothetical protein
MQVATQRADLVGGHGIAGVTRDQPGRPATGDKQPCRGIGVGSRRNGRAAQGGDRATRHQAGDPAGLQQVGRGRQVVGGTEDAACGASGDVIEQVVVDDDDRVSGRRGEHEPRRGGIENRIEGALLGHIAGRRLLADDDVGVLPPGGEGGCEHSRDRCATDQEGRCREPRNDRPHPGDALDVAASGSA